MARASQIRQRVAAALVVLGLVEGPLVFDTTQLTTTKSNRSFTLAFPDSVDTGKERVNDGYRAGHVVVVTLIHHLKQKDQEATLDAALDDGEDAVKAILTDAALNTDARVLWTSTRRRLTPPGDYLESVLSFDVETSIPLT